MRHTNAGAAAAFLLVVPAILAQAPQQARAGNSPAGPTADHPALSMQVVAYPIHVRLDPAKKSIDATETLVDRNLTGQSLETFPFHLYTNAFQPRSTFMTETRLYGTRGFGARFKWEEKYRGGITVSPLEADGMGDLTGKMRFIQLDHHNPNERAGFELSLPKPAPPGRSINFRTRLHDQIPVVVRWSGRLSQNAPGPRLGFWVEVFGLLVVLFLMTAVRLWADMAQVRMIVENEQKATRALRAAFRLTLRNFFSLCWLCLRPGLLAGIFFGGVFWFRVKLVPPQAIGAWFLLGELVLLVWLAARLWQRVGEVAWYLQASPVTPPQP